MTGTETFNKVTWKVNVSYKLDDTFLPYATVSTGFRSGGLNPQQEPFEPIPGAFAPDTLTNYEVGAKGRLFGGALDYQADVYLIHGQISVCSRPRPMAPSITSATRVTLKSKAWSS